MRRESFRVGVPHHASSSCKLAAGLELSGGVISRDAPLPPCAPDEGWSLVGGETRREAAAGRLLRLGAESLR